MGFILACGSNCRVCEINGANSCDDSGCNPGYGFVVSSKSCIGEKLFELCV